MNIRGAKPHQTWAQWEDELHQEILKLWTKERTVKEIAFFLQLSEPYVIKVLKDKLDVTYKKFVGPMQDHTREPSMLMCVTAGFNMDKKHIRPEYQESFNPLDAPDYFPMGGVQSFTYGKWSMASAITAKREYIY